MAIRHRLPRRVRLGRGYVIEVVLVSPAFLREHLADHDGEELDGCWEPSLDEPVSGRIYVRDSLVREQQWVVYWHELLHAINDIAAYDIGVAI